MFKLQSFMLQTSIEGFMCPVEDKDKDTFESKFCSNIFGLLEHLVAIFLQCGKMLEFSARHANLRKKVPAIFGLHRTCESPEPGCDF